MKSAIFSKKAQQSITVPDDESMTPATPFQGDTPETLDVPNPSSADKNVPPRDHKVLLIDLENCPGQIKQLQSDVTSFAQVVICYAHNSPRIPLDWLTSLAAAVNRNKLRIVKMEQGGKNAADFGLCFFAGALMESLPKETHFVIVSNDTDLDHTVRLLQSQGRTAERLGTQREEPANQTDNAQNGSPLGTYCTYLIAHSKNRPAKQETLLNSLKNKFKDAPTTAGDVFKALLSQSAIEIVDSKVVYNDKKIRAFATG